MDFFTDNFQKKSNNKGAAGRRSLMIKVVETFNKNERIQSHIVEPRRGVSHFDKPYVHLEGWSTEKYQLENFRMELLKKNTHEETDKHVVMQLHGGGYVNAFKTQYRRMAQWYSEAYNYADVLSIDYRVAPENSFPAPLEDAAEAYRWLLENGYRSENIIVAGDSAGGGLALVLCLYLRDEGMPLPAGLICMSPWTDLTMSNPSYKDNYEKDIIIGDTQNSIIVDNPYLENVDTSDPYMSPLFGDPTGLPPILIQVGTNEMLYDDSRLFCEKARQAGVKVRLTEYEDMFHVFQLCGPMLDESKAAWEEIEEFTTYLSRNNK